MPFKIPVPIIEFQSGRNGVIFTGKNCPVNVMRLVIIILMLGATLAARGADSVFESGPQKTHLLELFTSEGCSSCPPAEAWLSKLKAEPRLWKDFVPVAFHVDYWDRLGWRDPFAAKEWTARQYQYAANWKGNSVYTPGFVLDGAEWRNTGVPTAAGETVGSLKISLEKEGRLIAEFRPAKSSASKFDLHVARLGFDLKTNVTGGENNGRKLQHDFIVLSLVDGKITEGKGELKLTETDAHIGAIAAWVTLPDQIEPIQAVGGWLH
jgi:hypothetical protein